MSHLDDLWSVMVIYFPGARGKVERSIEVNEPRPEIVPRYHGVLGSCKLCVITGCPFCALNHLYRCHSSNPNLRALCGINGYTKLKAETNGGNIVKINHNSSGSDMGGEMNEDDDGIYDFAPLPPIDFQRKSEENYPSY